MRIYLVQHGEAKSQEIDPDRHLTEKGIDDVKKTAAFLKKAGVRVKTIWHSGKTRAEETAGILASAVSTERGAVRHDGLAPNDNISAIKDELSDKSEDMMIVGHLPFLSKLASKLVAGDESSGVAAFQQGGVVCLERGDDKIWTIQWMIIPQLIP